MAYAKPIPAYVPVIGTIRGYMEEHAGHQPGDPDKAAKAILQLVEMKEPPLRLPLGNDALAFLRANYKFNAEELERWADIIRSTDFDGLATSDTDHPVLKLQSSMRP